MEENILEKYARLRSLIKQGDVILFHGHTALAKLIQEADSDAYWNHIGIVMEVAGVLFIVDSNAPGVHPERLSVRMKYYAKNGGDFAVKRSMKTEVEINKALFNVLNLLEEEGEVKYDFINGLKSMLNRRFNTNFKLKLNKNRVICSMFAYPYEIELDMVKSRSFYKSLFFPEDTIRYAKNMIHVC